MLCGNLNKCEWIFLKLQHKVPFPQRNAGIDFGVFDLNYLEIKGQQKQPFQFLSNFYNVSNI